MQPLEKNKTLELLAPAKNKHTGKHAINYGADAVYIGAPQFGARAAATNSLQDIEELVQYAHLYKAKVYIAFNTILYDNELEDAQRMIRRLYEAGADALIIQDFGILEMNLPPIALHASTQTNNYSLEHIQFVEQCGFERIILARELSLEQINTIKNNTSIELEAFIHGALCVGRSGRCYLSHQMSERSSNRGECAQVCRLDYSLLNASKETIIKDKPLLSIKDLNLNGQLEMMAKFGITSFKIEGRLKDETYVKNIVALYRKELDSLINRNNDYAKASSGKACCGFEPVAEKSFNRGFSTYFFENDIRQKIAAGTSKSIGEKIGTVTGINEQYFSITPDHELKNGDGICFFNQQGLLIGTNVTVNDDKIFFNKENDIQKNLFVNAAIYRNNDIAFEKQLENDHSVRKISLALEISENNDYFEVSATDEDGIKVVVAKQTETIPCHDVEKNKQNIIKQFHKTGGSIFEISDCKLLSNFQNFYPISLLNLIRRELFENLEQQRIASYKRKTSNTPIAHPAIYQETLDYDFNIANKNAIAFFSQCGAAALRPAFELKQKENAVLMRCKYCLKYELNACSQHTPAMLFQKLEEPLYLSIKDRHYKLHFDCKNCEMLVTKANPSHVC